jgi:hypothetical protein
MVAKNGRNIGAFIPLIITELSRKLSQEFGKGFNERNLWYMKNFYLTFPKVNALRSDVMNKKERPLRTRLISARRATRQERRKYEKDK